MDGDGNFETVDELVAHLVAGGGCEEDEARRVIAGLMVEDRGGRPPTPASCWNAIVDFGYLDAGAKSGWVTREGKMLSAVWGAHERLLGLLGMEVREVEEMGWVRVTPFGWQCGFRLSREQRRRVERSGFLVDGGAERLKPHWKQSGEDAPVFGR